MSFMGYNNYFRSIGFILLRDSAVSFDTKRNQSQRQGTN